jgi:hypothetical protein
MPHASHFQGAKWETDASSAMSLYRATLLSNIDGVARFVAGMLAHQGRLNVDRLHVVDLDGVRPRVRLGRPEEKRSDYAIGTGGEVVNSYCTLYELGYMFMCLFLAGVGTAVLNSPTFRRHRDAESPSDLPSIRTDLALLSEDEIVAGMRHPLVGIVASMDTDVVPLRYNKHQLWRLDPRVLGKRVAAIAPGEFGVGPESSPNPDHWTARDRDLAETAMSAATSLGHAKAIQYYLVLQIVFDRLGIDVRDVPLYFNFVPKEEIVSSGPTSSFLEAIVGLHTPENKNRYRQITGIKSPWMITKACPSCGQGDKRILTSKLMGDGVTVRVHCKPNETSFRNERGERVGMCGCDDRFEFRVPETPQALYEFCVTEDFTLHFAARQLIAILKDTIDTPIGIVLGDMGVLRDRDGCLVRNAAYPQGYGDHLDMMTSALALEHFFITGEIAGETSARLRARGLLMPQPLMVFGYDRPTELVDPDIVVQGEDGTPVHVSDTSALKALERGSTAEELFQLAVHIHCFSLDELLGTRGRSLGMFEAMA